MAEKYQNKYRIPSIRLQNWDYRRAGGYFITICTKGRQHYFGQIRNKKMHLSQVGVIADLLWHEIKNHSKNVILGEFVVMPDHIHGILILTGNGGDARDARDAGDAGDAGPAQTGHAVQTGHALSLPHAQSQSQSPPPTQSQSLPPIGRQRYQNIGKNSVSSIIGSYKSAVTKHANRLGFEFGWQPLFYESIARDPESLERISRYIRNNPIKWKEDNFYKK
jgi:REP element-mobilizing transposase RayT